MHLNVNMVKLSDCATIFLHMHTHTHTHTLCHTRIHTHIHCVTRTRAHTRTCTHTQTHTNKQTLQHTVTYMQTHSELFQSMKISAYLHMHRDILCCCILFLSLWFVQDLNTVVKMHFEQSVSCLICSNISCNHSVCFIFQMKKCFHHVQYMWFYIFAFIIKTLVCS